MLLTDITMGIWNFYFIAKLFLYGGRFIDFHVVPNLVFASLLSIPVTQPRLRMLRQVIAVPTGIALLYHDSWLPPFSRALSQASLLAGFSPAYLMELAGRLVNPLAIAGLVVLFVIYCFASRKLRKITPFVFVAMLVPLLPLFAAAPAVNKLSIPFPTGDGPSSPAETGTGAAAVPAIVGDMANPPMSPSAKSPPHAGADVRGNTEKAASEPAKTPPRSESSTPATASISGSITDAGLTTTLNSFYRQEAARTATFPPAAADAPFDIILLQICSLSWDDLEFTKERNNALFRRFNVVFTNFGSAATYSGPSVIRTLRGSCGQQRHGALYEPFSPQCLTYSNLQKIGFEPQMAINHDGRFAGFLADVRERGGMKAVPFEVKGAPPYLKSFDGSPIHDDYSVLSKWWEQRLQASSSRVALFYNSVSLHDGNRYADGRGGNSMEIYHPRLKRLLGDLDRFFTELEASGRRVVVVFIPEHGAAARGDKMQIAGMREIPSPRITIVPVGIKLIGLAESPEGKPLVITKPTSYLAVSQLMANFVRTSPFGNGRPGLEKYVADLPSTEFVAENNDVVVMRRGRQYFIRSKDAGWIEYDPSD